MLKASTQHLRPKFSLELLQKNYCLSRCTQTEKIALIERLHELSQLTWQMIMQTDRHRQGCEKIDHKAIKTALPPFINSDMTLLAFRFYGKAPMVGFREAEVFFIVWLDRDFTLYRH
jgi:hypothetical protein